MWLPSVIFGAFSVAAAFLLIFMPETKGRPLLESIRATESAWTKKKSDINTVTETIEERDNSAFELDEKNE